MFKSLTSNVCIDIGGTNTRVALIEDNNIVELKKFPTNENPNENFQMIINVINKWQFNAIGISTAGPIFENGVYGKLPNLPKYENFNIYSAFAMYNVPITIEKDANCSAYAEHQSEDYSTLYITVSTGIGGGFVVNNEIFKGSTNNALEIHKFQSKDGINIEDVCSGPGIYKTAVAAGLDVNDTADVFRLFESSKIADDIINNSIEVLATAISNIDAILNPTTIVFGGSVVQNNLKYYELLKLKIQQKIGNNRNIKLSNDSESSTLLGINKILRRENEFIKKI